jgi:CheY-like chemotaxis protein
MDETDVILLVEDNPDDVALIRRAFRRAGLGASIKSVADGELAVAYLAGEAPYAEPASIRCPP